SGAAMLLPGTIGATPGPRALSPRSISTRTRCLPGCCDILGPSHEPMEYDGIAFYVGRCAKPVLRRRAPHRAAGAPPFGLSLEFQFARVGGVPRRRRKPAAHAQRLKPAGVNGNRAPGQACISL